MEIWYEILKLLYGNILSSMLSSIAYTSWSSFLTLLLEGGYFKKKTWRRLSVGQDESLISIWKSWKEWCCLWCIYSSAVCLQEAVLTGCFHNYSKKGQHLQDQQQKWTKEECVHYAIGCILLSQAETGSWKLLPVSTQNLATFVISSLAQCPAAMVAQW